MWSVISITEPGGMSARSEPAALVRISVLDAERLRALRAPAAWRPRRRARSSGRGRPACSTGMPPKCAGDQLAGMAGDAALREAGQVGIGDADGVLDRVGERRRGRSRARCAIVGVQPAEPFDEDVGGRRSFQDVSVRSRRAAVRPSSRSRTMPVSSQRCSLRVRPREFGEALAAAAAGRDAGHASRRSTAISAILPPPPMT